MALKKLGIAFFHLQLIGFPFSVYSVLKTSACNQNRMINTYILRKNLHLKSWRPETGKQRPQNLRRYLKKISKKASIQRGFKNYSEKAREKYFDC